jgi:hypothetical protein
LTWGSSGVATPDSGISRLAGASLAIGNGTAGDTSGSLTIGAGASGNPSLIVGTAGVGIWENFGVPSLVSNNSVVAAYFYTGTTFCAQVQIQSSVSAFVAANTNNGVGLFGRINTTTTAGVSLENLLSFVGTSGTQVGVSMGGSSTLVFNPPSGTASFIACDIVPTLEGTSSGNTTALVVNPTLTATNLTGTNLIASFQSAGTHELDIDYSGNILSISGSVHSWNADSGISRLGPASLAIGNGTAGDFSGTLKCATVNATSAYQANGTPGVTQTAIAVGTLATIEGIVTTFTGVSDERLKNHAPYTGGLEEILGITPIRFTYNELGQKFGGWDKEHVYVGFSAQNVQKSIPEAIQGTEGKEKYLSFDDRPVIAALCNAIKELTARITELEMSVRYLLEHCRRSVPGNRAQ